MKSDSEASQQHIPVASARDYMPLTLFIHTGTHKTGSTAIQAYLAANADNLKKHRISYQFPHEPAYLMGNGQYLVEQTLQKALSEDQLASLINQYFSGESMAVCSSEDFTRFKEDHWTIIREITLKLGVKVEFLTLIRDIEGYYYSLYGQLVKGGEITSSYEDFAQNNQYYPVIDSLKCLLTLFGRESLHVAHYDSNKNQLDEVLMGWLGLSASDFDRSVLLRSVNRSLVSYEIQQVLKFNRATGRQYSDALYGYLVNKRPDLREVRQVDLALSNELIIRHRDDLAWINKTFFSGDEIVRIGNTAKVSEPNLGTEDQAAIDKDVIDWCISIMQGVDEKSIRYISNRLLTIDWENKGNPVIPDDFDPIAYLLLNKDILLAETPPYKHFIESGRLERRRWTWPAG